MNNLQLDENGFLLDFKDWDFEIAKALNKLLETREQVIFSEELLAILSLIRNFYQEFNEIPNNRVIVNLIKVHLNKEQANSIHLNALFNGFTAKKIAFLAGLPKPINCF